MLEREGEIGCVVDIWLIGCYCGTRAIERSGVNGNGGHEEAEVGLGNWSVLGCILYYYSQTCGA